MSKKHWPKLENLFVRESRHAYTGTLVQQYPNRQWP